jgi:hypothetical protein
MGISWLWSGGVVPNDVGTPDVMRGITIRVLRDGSFSTDMNQPCRARKIASRERSVGSGTSIPRPHSAQSKSIWNVGSNLDAEVFN